MQVGRVGPPLQSWTVQAQPGQVWSTTLWLPVSASFVGLRGPTEMESAIDAVTITPTAVVDAGARPIVPAVVSAAHLRRRERVLPRRAYVPGAGRLLGAWQSHRAVHGRGPDRHTAPVVLRIHSGGKANLATFTTFDWEREYSLVPGQAEEVELPMVNGSVIPLTVAVETGFYPKDLDPQSTDARFLGIWVELSASAKATADK